MNKYTTTCEEKEWNLWEEPLTQDFRPSRYMQMQIALFAYYFNYLPGQNKFSVIYIGSENALIEP